MTDTNQLIVNFRGGVGEVEETSEETKQKARMTICALAEDAADAALLMAILGLTPDKKLEHRVAHCKECDFPMSRQAVAGIKKAGKDGLCRGCTAKTEKPNRPAKPPRHYVSSARTKTGNTGRCKTCLKATATRVNQKKNEVRYGGLGMCERCYQDHRRDELKAENPALVKRVLAGASRLRLCEMHAAGMTRAEMSAVTGVPRWTIGKLLDGWKGKPRQFVARETEQKILGAPFRRAS